jgi:hypothetical protein
MVRMTFDHLTQVAACLMVLVIINYVLDMFIGTMKLRYSLFKYQWINVVPSEMDVMYNMV